VLVRSKLLLAVGSAAVVARLTLSPAVRHRRLLLVDQCTSQLVTEAKVGAPYLLQLVHLTRSMVVM
jgi:hypothetical protein